MHSDSLDRLRPTPPSRPKRLGLLRNAAIVLGNQRQTSAVPTLARGLSDFEPLLRGAWALGCRGGQVAEDALSGRLTCEEEADVRDEITAVLDDCAG